MSFFPFTLIHRLASKKAKGALDAGMVFCVESAGSPELLSEIKTKLERENGIDVPTSQIMATAGAKQAIFSAMFSTIDPGDEVLIPDPYWGSFLCERDRRDSRFSADSRRE